MDADREKTEIPVRVGDGEGEGFDTSESETRAPATILPFPSLRIRRVLESDFPRLVEIYTEAVRQTAKKVYSPEQINAWAAFPMKADKFREFVFGPKTWVIVEERKPVAFCGLDDDGHIASLYVHPEFNRRGYGSRLLQHVLDRGERWGMRRFYTEASYLSRTVFERQGFIVDYLEEVDYDGVHFCRFKMVRRLDEEEPETVPRDVDAGEHVTEEAQQETTE